MTRVHRFSIILPTYNRRDTIIRAVNSVLAQTFTDFELLVTDDGSTDGTIELLEGLDPRISVQRQDNAGSGQARNAALRRSTGEYVAFLDSDDEWLPHYLALADAFFRAFPDEHLFSGEFWADYGEGKTKNKYEKHFRTSVDWFLSTAQKIGQDGLSLPVSETDDYLRIYSTRADVGDWGRAVLNGLPYKDVYHYTGDIYPHFRWGFLLALQNTVLSRKAIERIGEFDTSYPIASDFGFLARACAHYAAHMVSVPVAIKYEYAAKKNQLAEGHIATGATAFQFAKDMLRWHEALFWSDHQDDPELSAIHAIAQLFVAKVGLDKGHVDEATVHLSKAVKAYPGPEAWMLLVAAQVLTASGARKFSNNLFRAQMTHARIVTRMRDLLGTLVGHKKNIVHWCKTPLTYDRLRPWNPNLSASVVARVPASPTRHRAANTLPGSSSVAPASERRGGG